jgi:hypothetical protein
VNDSLKTDLLHVAVLDTFIERDGYKSQVFTLCVNKLTFPSVCSGQETSEKDRISNEGKDKWTSCIGFEP